MTLHDRIMAMTPYVNGHMLEKVGFKIARKHAAQLATEADELMAEMADLIGGYKLIMQEMGVKPNRTDVLLAKYNTYKELNNVTA